MHIYLSRPALQTPPKFHDKTPRERKKERKCSGRGKKKREILGPPPFGAPPFWAVMATFGQTAFGQNRIWPKKVRIWPGHFRDRIWPKHIWPELVFSVFWPSVCVCCVFKILVGVFKILGGCLQDFWAFPLPLLPPPERPLPRTAPSPGPPPPPDGPKFRSFFSLPLEISFFLLSGVFSLNIGCVFEGRRGFTRQPESPNVHI